jgi:hypothetical protein
MKQKNHFKMAIKAKKLFTKNCLILLGINKTKTNVIQLCCGQRAYVGYVGWKNLKSAGLPKINKINDQDFLRAN